MNIIKCLRVPVIPVSNFGKMHLPEAAKMWLISRDSGLKFRNLPCPTVDRFNPDPQPIKRIYVLRPEDRNDIKLEPRTGLQRFNDLRNQVYKKRFVKFMGQQETYLKTLGQFSSQVSLSRAYRPFSPVMLDELVEILEKDFLRS